MKKIKNDHGFIFKFLMKIIKLFKKQPKIYNMNDEKVSV